MAQVRLLCKREAVCSTSCLTQRCPRSKTLQMAGEMKVMNIHKIFAKHDTDLTQIEGVMNTWYYPLTRAEVRNRWEI